MSAGPFEEVGSVVRNYSIQMCCQGLQAVCPVSVMRWSARNAAAAAPTTGLAPAASDLVSAMTAAQFGQQGVAYQQIAAQAAEVHEQLVAALRSGAGAYALAEAANAAAAG